MACSCFSEIFQRPLFIINCFCVFAFLIQIFYLVKDQFHPKTTQTSLTKSDLSNVHFPMVFTICLKRIESNDIRFNEAGYNNLESYYQGKSLYNSSIIGWAGHTSNGNSMDTVKGIILLAQFIVMYFFQEYWKSFLSI